MDRVLTRSRVERRIDEGTLAAWKADRYRTFHETLVADDPPFPCYFAVDAHERGDLRYLFPEAPGSDASGTVADGLATYLDRAPGIADVTSLVVLFEPPAGERPPEWYERQFWGLLEGLHEQDPEPWPESVPHDPSDAHWAFSFADTPLFLVARAPFYDRRRSRYTPHGLEITVQPRWVFDGLGADTERGQQAREVIRDRLGSYDEVPPHPDIGAYGDSSSREWQQYFVPPSNDESLEQFPFEVS
jgi:hypothetical protein